MTRWVAVTRASFVCVYLRRGRSISVGVCVCVCVVQGESSYTLYAGGAAKNEGRPAASPICVCDLSCARALAFAPQGGGQRDF